MRKTYSKLLTVVVPCYNEQKTIGKVVSIIKKSLKISKIFNYEIIIVNDASTDKTINELNKIKEKKLKIVNNYKNLGLGKSVLKGYKLAKGKYCMYVPGDNTHPVQGLVMILKKINFLKEELIIPYVKDNRSRHFLRVLLSSIFTITVNFLFNLKIPYYNSLAVYPVSKIKKIKKVNGDFSFQAQLIIILIKKFRLHYKFVGTIIKENKEFFSNAVRLKNILLVIKSIIRLNFNFNKK
tara:strand:+ start:4259 stop:4972 length:714 start_codon:yes stop_codon:yes gene_type:complete